MRDPAYFPSSHAPTSVGSAVETVRAACGQSERLRAIMQESPAPMALIDGRRRYVDVNRPARLLFRLSLAEMRASRVEDLVPPDGLSNMMAAWERMLEIGYVTGTRELPGPDGGRLRILYYGLANVLPGLHLGAFAPAGWTEDELGLGDDPVSPEPAPLTPREREILQLAAEGLSTATLAKRLVVSPATVKSHLGSSYEKLGATGRAGAVAKAMRLGIIV